MKSIATIRNIHGGLKSDAVFVAGVARELDQAIQDAKNDSSRSPEWRSNQIDSARKSATTKISDRIKQFNERVAAMVSERRYWKDNLFLLRHQMFDDNAVSDATIRAQHLRECEAMPPAMLQLTADSAKEDGNLPLLWQCVLAGWNRESDDGWKGIDLEGVTIPHQAEAMQLIADAEAMQWSVHSALTVARGGVVTGVERLTFGHMLENARPGGTPTRHNSQGRA